jgi:hypothetical protein
MITMTLARPDQIADELGMTTDQLEDLRHSKESPDWIIHDGEVLYVLERIEKPRIRSPKKPVSSTANDLMQYFDNPAT